MVHVHTTASNSLLNFDLSNLMNRTISPELPKHGHKFTLPEHGHKICSSRAWSQNLLFPSMVTKFAKFVMPFLVTYCNSSTLCCNACSHSHNISNSVYSQTTFHIYLIVPYSIQAVKQLILPLALIVELDVL